MDFCNFEFHPSKLPADKKERAAFLDGLKQEIITDLRNAPRYKEFFAQPVSDHPAIKNIPQS